MPIPGYIYVLVNNSMPNLVKVGKTARDTESRAKELSAVTGVPTPFNVAYEAYFSDCSRAEEYVHIKLEQQGYRLSANREFFQVPLKEVIRIVVSAEQTLISDTGEAEAESELQTNPLESESKAEPWSETEALAEYLFNTSDYQESYRLYKKCIDLGSTSAYCNIGLMTLRGWGCIEDHEEGLTFLNKGANAKNANCYGQLALYHFDKDYELAIKWLELYLESGADIDVSVFFHCCFNMVLESKYSKKGPSISALLSKYQACLAPLKDALINNAINQIDCVSKNYPDIKPHYVEVAQEIKRNL